MFNIDEKTDRIQITRGDSCALSTYFYIDENDNDIQDGGEQTHIISGNECVVFTVRSRESGVVKIKRILTEEDYADGELSFEITPRETLIPFDDYEYSFLYLPDKNIPNHAYTYAQGIFEILHSVSEFGDSKGNGTENMLNLQAKYAFPSVDDEVITPDIGFDGLSKVTVRHVRLQNKVETADVIEKEVTADNGYDALSTCVIAPVTRSIDPNIRPENIKKGVIILGVTGTYEGGTA